MNINHFMLLHVEKHRRACFTIYWFLKGRIDLNTLVRFTMAAEHKKDSCQHYVQQPPQ